MTEADWLASEDTAAMLRLRRTDCCGCWWTDNGDGTVSLASGARPCGQCDQGPILPYPPWGDRKLRLFACSCCRLGLHLLSSDFADAISAAEEYADGKTDAARLNRFFEATTDRRARYRSQNGWHVAYGVCQCCIASEDFDAAGIIYELARHDVGRAAMADLFREIIGNPFRPVALDPAWLTTDVRSLAAAAYSFRSPDGTLDDANLKALWDALEESGCDCEEIRAHLCDDGDHYRGCWAVDSIIGKS